MDGEFYNGVRLGVGGGTDNFCWRSRGEQCNRIKLQCLQTDFS